MGAPGFKDLVASDISAVFLNGQEFADTHTIDGKPMTVVVDENELLERDKSKMGIDPGMVQNGGGPVLRLKANKTSLYNLVATYKPLPGMRRVDFQKANGRPDYWLEWTTDDGHTKAFLSSSLGHPILTITTHDAVGGQLYHEAHRLSVEGLRERGMVEEVTTAMERRRQAHGRA